VAGGPRVCLGVITGAHGVRGLVRLKSFTAEPEAVAGYGPLEDEAGARRFDLVVRSRAKGHLIASIDGIADRDAAEGLRGVHLYVDRAALPEPDEPEEFYRADLIGMAVETVDGQAYGTVRTVEDFGAGDVIEIELAAGGTVALPFTRAIFPRVDLPNGRLVVDPPEETEARQPPR